MFSMLQQCSTNSDVSDRALQRQANQCHECCSTDKCNKPLCEHFKRTFLYLLYYQVN